jgi:hypothetical protein
MTGTEEKPSARLKLLRRLIPLAVLGAVVALVVGQISRMITHDVTLKISMTPGLADGLEWVELAVSDTQDPDEIVSLTVFRMDAQALRERRLTHTLRLTAGEYALAFKLVAAGDSPRAVIRRTLDVSSDTAVSINLP